MTDNPTPPSINASCYTVSKISKRGGEQVMAMSKMLKNYLKVAGVDFEIVVHPEVYTAQEMAAAMHVPGAQFAKVVMVRFDDDLVTLVMPAEYHIDFELLREVSGVKKVELAKEEDFAGSFPDCDLGAMPPFGNLYGIPVWVDEHMAGQETIVFNACTHYEALKMSFSDYEKLVNPKVASFGTHV
jgi:Ala-tRNA(Pro) deacylase